MHFTHVENLRGIFDDGRLKADTQVRDDGVLITECAETSIKQRRRAVRVPVHPGGHISDYVPFYFAPRSPMLFSIHSGNVPTYTEGQEPLVYFWTRLSNIEALVLP